MDEAQLECLNNGLDEAVGENPGDPFSTRARTREQPKESTRLSLLS